MSLPRLPRNPVENDHYLSFGGEREGGLSSRGDEWRRSGFAAGEQSQIGAGVAGDASLMEHVSSQGDSKSFALQSKCSGPNVLPNDFGQNSGENAAAAEGGGGIGSAPARGKERLIPWNRRENKWGYPRANWPWNLGSRGRRWLRYGVSILKRELIGR
jgi:hypothetical protein